MTGYNLAFGFRRLAVLDLFAHGPANRSATVDRRCWIIYNGAIYNYRELRSELQAKGYTFRTGTDTEVILYAYAEWGQDCLSRFNGMWGFALWDSWRRRLFCARDRFGVKPFYYYWNGAMFAFASEIKALLHLPHSQASERRHHLRLFALRTHGSTRTRPFISRSSQLRTGHCLTLQAEGVLHRHPFYTLDVDRPLRAGDGPQHAAGLPRLIRG